MEVSLVHNASLTFQNDASNQFCLLQDAVWSSSVKLINVTGIHTNHKLENKLNSLLIAGPTADTAILCAICIAKDKDATEHQLRVMWASRGNGSFFRTLPPQVVNGAGLQMRMEFADVNNFQKISTVYPLKDMVIRKELPTLSILIMDLGNVPINLANKWKNQAGRIGEVSGKLSLNIIFDEEFLTAYFAENAPMDHCRSILAKMLENAEGEGDTVITGAGGTTVKCHRAVLVASSPYFQAMFQSGVWESTTNEVNMTDMTEGEIRAFLRYLYKCDVKPGLENIQTAWMLLKAGNYYQLDELVSVMREILMIRGYERFSVELALEMLLFAKNVCGISGCATGRDSDQVLNVVWSDLSLKAVQVLKWYSKERPLELMASEKYKKLYEETPQLAMELHSKFLQYLDTDEIERGVNK